MMKLLSSVFSTLHSSELEIISELHDEGEYFTFFHSFSSVNIYDSILSHSCSVRHFSFFF